VPTSAMLTETTSAKEPPTMEPKSTTLSTDAQAILESMGDAFYALDGMWRIVYANRRAMDRTARGELHEPTRWFLFDSPARVVPC
jgi:PAS domain-containing protein